VSFSELGNPPIENWSKPVRICIQNVQSALNVLRPLLAGDVGAWLRRLGEVTGGCRQRFQPARTVLSALKAGEHDLFGELLDFFEKTIAEAKEDQRGPAGNSVSEHGPGAGEAVVTNGRERLSKHCIAKPGNEGMSAPEIERIGVLSAIEDDRDWKFAAVAERFELLFEAPR
jgi:hypothetical protein